MSTGQLQLIWWPSHSKVIDRIADKECKMGFGKPLEKTKYNSDCNSDHTSRKSRGYTSSSRVLIGIPVEKVTGLAAPTLYYPLLK